MSQFEQHHLSLREHCRDALVNLMATKLRTFLAILGILVGAASVVAMISGGELMSRQVLLQFKSLGTNLLAVSVNDAQSTDAQGSTQQVLTLADAQATLHASPKITQAAPYATLYLPMRYAGDKLDGGLLGATDTLQGVMKLHLATGRFISFLDNLSYFCVIGYDLYRKILETTGKTPLGEQINVQGTFFTVVGVLKPWPANTFLFADLNHAVIVPLSTALTLSQYAEINNLLLRIDKTTDIEQLKEQLGVYFQRVAPGKQLYFQSPQQIIDSMKKQQQILTLFLGFIGAISLIVGGIGVMNIMLVSVTERKREIGIRMALGATRRDIQRMFLVEAIMLSLFGGVLGVLLGISISYIIALVKAWQFTLFLMPPVIGFGISVLIGIFFGFYPAYKAAKLNPIACLRAE